jgi:hypothetical protein
MRNNSIAAGVIPRLATELLKTGDRDGVVAASNLAKERGERCEDWILYDVRRSVVSKAAVEGLTIGDAAALAALREASEAFLSGPSASVFDRMMDGGFRAGTLHARYGVASSGATAYAHVEGKAKPLTRLTAIEGSLESQTIVAFVVASQDLLRFSRTAEALVDGELSKAVRLATDAHVIPILVNGATTVTATADVRKNLGDAVAAITAGTDSVLYALMPATLQRRMAVLGDLAGAPAFPGLTMSAGSIGGMFALPCDALEASGDVVIVDAQGFVADADPLQFNVFREGSVEMADDPSSAAAEGSPPQPAGATMVNLFQTNSAALKAERRIGLAKLRTGSNVVISGAAGLWGLEGSPPS